MANLYIITGPSGVGKSTISKKIAESKSKSALIEGDYIYSQVIGGYVSAWKDGNHLDVFWDICLNTIESYLSYDYDVIFNYIVIPNIIKVIKERFKKYAIKFVVLITDEETILKRDSQRPVDCQMKERCIILLNNFKNRNYDKKHFLDSSNLSADETAYIIENQAKFLL